MYCACATRPSLTTATKVIAWFLIVMCAMSGTSAWAEVHIIYDSTSAVIPNGSVGGGLWDSMSWLGTRDSYASGVQYIGDSPVSGYLSCDSPDDAVGPLYAASEVGITEDDVFYVRAHAESSVSTNPLWGYPIYTIADGRGGLWFTLDYAPLSLHWIAENFEGYEDLEGFPDTGWEIELGRLTFTPEGTYYDPVYRTDSDQELASEGTQLIELDPAYTYQLTWHMDVASYTPGDHGWARFALDLVNLGDTPSPIPAVIDVVADTITPRTRSITCNIWLPDGYNVTDIAVESIRLQGTVSPTSTSVRKGQMLVVKFPTTGLNLQPGDLALTVSGQLADGALFKGSDSITVVQKGGKK